MIHTLYLVEQAIDASLRALGFNNNGDRSISPPPTITPPTEEKKAHPPSLATAATTTTPSSTSSSTTSSPSASRSGSGSDEKRSGSPPTIPNNLPSLNMATSTVGNGGVGGPSTLSPGTSTRSLSSSTSSSTIVLPPLPAQWSALAGVYVGATSPTSNNNNNTNSPPSSSSSKIPLPDLPASHAQLLAASLAAQLQRKQDDPHNSLHTRERSNASGGSIDATTMIGGLHLDDDTGIDTITTSLSSTSSSSSADSNKIDTNLLHQQIDLSIGGHLFTTTVSTLTSHRPSFFASMFSGRFPILRDGHGRVFVDRDGTHFRHILNFMRDSGPAGMAWEPSLLGLTVPELHQLLTECRFYHINPMVTRLQSHLLSLQQTASEETERLNRPVEQQTLFMVVYDADQLIPLTMQYLTKFGFRVVSTSVDRTIFYAVMVKVKGEPLADDVKRELSKRLSIHSKLWVYL
jgi:hypothetical protein